MSGAIMVRTGTQIHHFEFALRQFPDRETDRVEIMVQLTGAELSYMFDALEV